MRKAARISIVLSTVIVFAVSAFSQPMGFRRGRGLAKRSPAKILWVLKAKQKELNVTEEQLEKIQNLVFSFEEKMIQMRSQNATERLNLKKLMQDRENLDYDKIKAVLAKMSSNRQNMFIERLKLREDIQNVLTPEQREALKKATQEMLKKARFFQRGKRMWRFPGMRRHIWR